MMGSGGGIPGGRGGMPGGGMPEEPGAGRQHRAEGRSPIMVDLTTEFHAATVDDVRGRRRRRRSERRVIRNRRHSENPERYSKLGMRPPWVLCVDQLDWKDFVNGSGGQRLACCSFQSPRANSWS